MRTWTVWISQEKPEFVRLSENFLFGRRTFNPTFPNRKDYTTDAWDQITTASQITNPLAWMEVNDRDDVSYFSAHARLNFNLSP